MMLSPKEQRTLQQIDLDLNSSDPGLAEELQTFTPMRWRPRDWMFHLVPRMARLDGRRMLFLAALLFLLIGVAGVLFSLLVVGLAGITLSSVASSGYLVAVIGDFFRRRDSSP